MEREIKIPKEHALPHLSLALGEPLPENGYVLPEVINTALIEAV